MWCGLQLSAISGVPSVTFSSLFLLMFIFYFYHFPSAPPVLCLNLLLVLSRIVDISSYSVLPTLFSLAFFHLYWFSFTFSLLLLFLSSSYQSFLPYSPSPVSFLTNFTTNPPSPPLPFLQHSSFISPPLSLFPSDGRGGDRVDVAAVNSGKGRIDELLQSS